MEMSREYLVFEEGGQCFGFNLDEVDKVEEACQLETIKQLPEFVKGILNYHGDLLPVIDIGKIFLFPAREDKLSDRLIIVRAKGERMAFWVESVQGIVKKTVEEVKEAQRYFVGLDYVKGVFCYSDRTVVLSDISKLLTVSELQKLKQALQSKEQS